MERITPREIEYFESRADEADKMDQEKVEQRTKNLLLSIGLRIDDLKGSGVLDLGSGPSLLERSMNNHGIDIVSLDRHRSIMSNRPELKGKVVGDAKELPIKDESIDYIISTGASPPFFGTYGTEADTKSSINEMIRVLTKNGEARISPRAFGFIEKHWELPERLQKNWEDLTAEEQEERRIHTEKATHESFQYLVDQGYNIKSAEGEHSYTNQKTGKSKKSIVTYWILKK